MLEAIILIVVILLFSFLFEVVVRMNTIEKEFEEFKIKVAKTFCNHAIAIKTNEQNIEKKE